GPMITKKAVDKIDRLVKDAVNRGAKVLCGGSVLEGDGFFYPPTVLSEVSPDADMAHEEIFGPVAPITRFESEAQAILHANDTEYGLAAYLYTRDVARG
ncbi:aldehyde dehydrogenase family protein, partial [Mesorhizobium sp. M2D.F.Ca.ET.185.01.1.1]